MEKLGPDLIKDCGTQKEVLVPKTPEQETERLAEIEEARIENEARQAQEVKKSEALERLKLSQDKEILDLLEALGLTTPSIDS